MVVAVALHLERPLRVAELDVVEHGPDAASGVRAGDLYLRHMTVVDGHCVGQYRSDRAHELVAPVGGVGRVLEPGVEVIGEEVGPLVPLLGVHEPEVPGLQLLDLLDVGERVGVHGSSSASSTWSCPSS